MIKRPLASALAVAAATVVIGTLAATPALARGGAAPDSGRPCGPTMSTAGSGSHGSPWTLKSKYDDDAGLQVGEEFEINTNVVGQVWKITFTYNGATFATDNVTSTATGVRDVERASYTGGPSLMAINAVNGTTGETINGSVQDPVIPAACGRR